MDLINRLAAKRNTTVTVNGTTYSIDSNGLCSGVKESDAAKLLRNTEAWLEASAVAKGRVAQAQVKKTGIALIGMDGTEIPRPEAPVSAPVEVEAVEVEEPTTSWEVPEEGADWPDPTEEMPLAYLRQMADAYEVKYTARSNKKELVRKVMVEMYPDKA